MALKLRGFGGFEAVGNLVVTDKAVNRQHKVAEGKDPWAKVQLGINDGTSTLWAETSSSRTKELTFKTGKTDAQKEFKVKRPPMAKVDDIIKKDKVEDSVDPMFLALKKETNDLKDIGYGYKRTLKLAPTKDEVTGEITYGSEKVYIDSYDFTDAIANNIAYFKDKDRRFKVTGSAPSFEEYQGNDKTVFTFTSLIELHESEDFEGDTALQVDLPIALDSNSVNEKDFDFKTLAKKDVMDRLIPYNVYVAKWDKGSACNRLWKITLQLDLSALSFEEEDEEMTTELLAMYVQMFRTDEKGKAFKNGVYYSAVGIIEYFSAKGKVTLDAKEQLAIKMGWANELDLIKEKQNSIQGDKQTMLKLRRFKAGFSPLTDTAIKAADNWITEETTNGTKPAETKAKAKTKEKPIIIADDELENVVDTEEIDESQMVEVPKVESKYTIVL